MPQNAKNYGVATWKQDAQWATAKTQTADINQQMHLSSYAMQIINVLNVLVNAVGAVAKHLARGTQNMAHIPAVATIQHIVHIRKAVVLHGVWKNQNVQMAKLRFCNLVNGFAQHHQAVLLEREHPAYAEQERHYVAQCDKIRAPNGA